MRTVDIPAEGRGVVPGTAVGVASMALLTAISVGAANVPAAAPSNAAATQQLRLVIVGGLLKLRCAGLLV